MKNNSTTQDKQGVQGGGHPYKKRNYNKRSMLVCYDMRCHRLVTTSLYNTTWTEYDLIKTAPENHENFRIKRPDKDVKTHI